METEVRLAKVEVEVEYNKQAIERLIRIVAELRASNERSMVELRTSNERGLAELRASNERGLVELRGSNERSFVELRKEIRWVLGGMLTGFAAILGVLGRVGGWY